MWNEKEGVGGELAHVHECDSSHHCSEKYIRNSVVISYVRCIEYSYVNV